MIIKADTRRVEKRSILTGVVPTVPPSSDFTDGTWINTDLLVGEFFFNVPDQRVWIGTPTGALELTTAASLGQDLETTLGIGNSSGAYDIKMGLGKNIYDDTMTSYMALYNNGFYIDNGSGAFMKVQGSLFKIVASDFIVQCNYNSVGSGVIQTGDNFSSDLVTDPGNKSSIGIASDTTTIKAGIYNSVAMAGINNQLNAINSIIMGINNQYNLSSTGTGVDIGGNIIGGSNNTFTGAAVQSGDNLIFGNSNTIGNALGLDAFGSNFIIGSQNNINTNPITGIYGSNIFNSRLSNINIDTNATANFISGASHTITSSNIVNNIISGASHTITKTTLNNTIISGLNNTIPVSIANYLGLNQSLLIGDSNDMYHSGIMYGSVKTHRSSAGLTTVGYRTTNTTAVVLTPDGNTVGGTNTTSFTVETNRAYRVKITGIVSNTTNGEIKEWEGFGVVKNVGGTVSLVSAITLTSTVADAKLASATLTVAANNTNKSLDITATGISATLNWICNIEYVKVVLV